ncbi:MAG: ABC transporter ATP-binding protein [Alphaproteobacteria bacterium]|nr:ABC transporter ATP-binding protein [Alphaproteobacteria bacterium]
MALELKSLGKRFGAVKAVDNVSLTVADGEFFSLLGPSGCGKTTLLRTIAGILQPDSGTIALDGRDITQVPVHARNAALVFQSYALFPHLTVFENVAFGLRMRREKEAAIRARAGEALELVRLAGFGERYPGQISGGQQQRVALARALVVRPALLLLDEPLSNLDARLREEMRTEIRRIQRAVGITTILVTHDIQEAFALSDRIAVMNQGRTEQIGAPADIYLHPATRFVAEFAGQVNHFAVTVERVEGAQATVATAGGHRFRIALGGERPAAGRELHVMLRPERVRVGAPDCENRFTAEVEDVTYLGGLTVYRLRLGQDRLLAQAQNLGAASHRVGESVEIGWQAEDGVCLAGA